MATAAATVYDYLGSAPDYENLCEAWTELQLHAPIHYASAIDATAASDFVSTNDPNSVPPNVAVVFAAASTNEYEGHTGVSTGSGHFTSVWSDGEIINEPIARFASDNGAAFLGYHNFGRGVPKAASVTPASTTAPATSSAPTAGPTLSLPNLNISNPGQLALWFAVLLVVAEIWEVVCTTDLLSHLSILPHPHGTLTLRWDGATAA